MQNSEIAIEIENISKYYRIGVKDEMSDNLVSTFLNFLKKPIKNYNKYRSLYKFTEQEIIDDMDSSDRPNDIIWALKNISLQLKKGEILGIIGGNGAGKSTLLKILSRITPPSTGHAKIFGRVSCLLEVGTGFHPELTGRENVYLNGTVLGMKKNEIDSKFDEIVDFSGIEKFLDTPVKRYSSGMKVMLAFSVAAHLEPEILIIDEVLAVGDAQFQKKCLGKMDEVAQEGRTLLFVSHNMGAINQLCTRAVLLENSQIKNDGKPEEVISSYLTDSASRTSIWESPNINSQDDMKINRVRILSTNEEPVSVINHDQEFDLEISYDVNKEIAEAIIMCRIIDTFGIIVFSSWDTDSTGLTHGMRRPGKYVSKCRIVDNLLKPGIYLVTVSAFINHVKVYDYCENILSFEVSPLGYNLNPGRQGVITPVLDWEISRVDGAI